MTVWLQIGGMNGGDRDKGGILVVVCRGDGGLGE